MTCTSFEYRNLRSTEFDVRRNLAVSYCKTNPARLHTPSDVLAKLHRLDIVISTCRAASRFRIIPSIRSTGFVLKIERIFRGSDFEVRLPGTQSSPPIETGRERTAMRTTGDGETRAKTSTASITARRNFYSARLRAALTD